MNGQDSVTRVAVARPPGGGRASVRLSASGPVERPVIRPMLVQSDDRGAEVSLVPEGALLLAGDSIRIEVRVAAGATLELLEPAGTVAYPMAGSRAHWEVDVQLEPAATLVWAGEPFVVAEGASVIRRTRVSMAEGARVALREVAVLGRHGEAPGDLHQDLDVVRPGGSPLLRESLQVGPASSRLQTGGARAIATVLLLGERLPETGEGARLELDAHGTMVRGLASQSHRAVPAASWKAARSLALAHGSREGPREPAAAGSPVAASRLAFVAG
jgi:urease accessory protein